MEIYIGWRVSYAENLENLIWQATLFKIGASERKPTHCIALAALGILAGSWWCWVLGVHVQDVGESGAPDRWVKLEVPGRDIATDVQGRILGSGQKIVCLIDAPTSKPKQVLELIAAANKAIGEKKRFGLLVTAGKRTDLLTTVLQNLQLAFTEAEFFYVMLTQGTSQGARSMPSFCVYCRESAP